MKNLSILFPLALISSFAFAEVKIKLPESKCSTLDIRDKIPKLREHFSKPRNQDSVGWCYGFAAADLLSVELGESVSATHASAVYNSHIERNTLYKLQENFWGVFSKKRQGAFTEVREGGYIEEALKYIRKDGKICREDDFPFDGDYWSGIKGMITELENIKSQMSKKSFVSEEMVCQKISNLKSTYPLIDSDTGEIYATLLNSNINIALSELVKRQCENRLLDVGKNFEVKSTNRLKLRKRASERDIERFKNRTIKYFENIQSVLESGRPIGVSYNVKHITGSDGGHASVLTGMRFKDGVCQFKIRNSWGKGCYAYDPEKITGCDPDEGSFWITDQKFYEMVYNITYISPK